MRIDPAAADPEVMLALGVLHASGARFVEVAALNLARPELLLTSGREVLREEVGLSEKQIDRLLCLRRDLDPAAHVAGCVAKGIQVTALGDPDYPELLREIPSPPLVLYHQGIWPVPLAPVVGVIGTRRCSASGREIAWEMGRDLAAAGLTVASGMARGIDGAAHTGALEVEGGVTIAVLGCGIDICYPPEHRSLHRAIRERGLLVSECPPGIPPLAHHFPRRNRILAGLVQGLVVVEAPRESGALITADMAAEAGRDVFVVPGPARSPRFEGSFKLLEEGAFLAPAADHVLARFRILRESGVNEAPPLRLTPVEEAICDLLDEEGTGFDRFASRLALPVGEVLECLENLILKGHVERLPGSRFRRLRPPRGTGSAGST